MTLKELHNGQLICGCLNNNEYYIIDIENNKVSQFCDAKSPAKNIEVFSDDEFKHLILLSEDNHVSILNMNNNSYIQIAELKTN